MKQVLGLTMLAAIGLGTLGAQTATQHPLYPLNVGDKWTYRMIDLKAPPGKVDGKKKVVVEVERPEFYVKESKDSKDAKSVVDKKVGFILKSTSGGKTTLDHVVVLQDGISRIHAAGTPINPPLQFLKFGTKAGDTWECNSTSGNTTIKGTFSLREEEVTVPYGKTKAVVVSFTNNKAGTELVEIDYWFAKDVGMVKQRVREKDRETALELEKYEKK